MNLKITPWHYEELIKQGYTLDCIFLLKLIEGDVDITELCNDNVKISTLYLFLVRKGLVTTVDGKITTTGYELLRFIDSRSKGKIVKRQPDVVGFEEWWKSYPGTDMFLHKNKKFVGSRSLRQNKEECLLRFDKILLEGEYTAKDLIDALLLDVHQKKENSVKLGVNKLTYMQNSLTYLNQRSFEPYIELVKQGVKIEETPENTGGTDV
jgi:hypothetical protein